MCEALENGCDALEAEAISSNEQLLAFDVRSCNVRWNEHIVPLQSRTAPVYLQRQHGLISSYREPIGDHNRREVLLCHDMMGNYLEDRFYNSSMKYDDYRFYHWAAIDYFCYFSHHYITIPPSGWINAAHKHGVPVLGTFIAEGEEGSKLLAEVLHSRKMVEDVVEALIKLCNHFRFEGWLINVECKVETEVMENLYYFVERLREMVSEKVMSGIVFWYDSIIETGELCWQNEINSKNVRFCKAADATLLNYAWNSESLMKTAAICEAENIRHQRIFVGIDVFGRNQLAKFQSGDTLAHIVKHRYSTGLFAPGWTFETLQNFGYDITNPHGSDDVNEAFLQRNEKFWSQLWSMLATHPYSHLPFETDFCLGSGKRRYRYGAAVSDQRRPFFNLSLQSLQPSVPLLESAERCYEDAFNGGSCLRILNTDESFRLFVTDFRFQRGGLVFSYAYKLDGDDDCAADFNCILRICAANNARDCYLYLGDYAGSISVRQGRCNISPFNAKYHDQITGSMRISGNVPAELDAAKSNGWHLRHYVAAFDGPIQVKDIGVSYRRKINSNEAKLAATAYLGALFLDEFDVNEFQFPVDSNVALLQIYGDDLLN